MARRQRVSVRFAAGGALLIALTACGEKHTARLTPDDAPSVVQTQARSPAPPPRSVASLYAAHCAMCHGESGAGDGAASYLLYPKPRDFTAGMYRFKSTPGEQPPTREDVRRVIAQGIEHTAMPSFAAVLSEHEIDVLVDYVLGLKRDDGDATTAAEPITIPPAPAFTQKLVAQGRRIYEAAGCALCHGETGRGDGPSSALLVDSQNMPLPAADFTAGVFKSGRSAEDLYRTLVIGVPGTPMPSYVQSLESLELAEVDKGTDRIWALVAYLKSLETPRERMGERSDARIVVKVVNDAAMVDDPWHTAWENIKPTPLSLQPLWQRMMTPRAVEVRAIRLGDRVAICLEWPDADVNGASDSVHQFTDAAAVMFPLDGQIPVLTMGLGGTGGDGESAAALVNIWQWKATWQADADAEGRRDLRDAGQRAHAGVPADIYMHKSGDPVSGPLTELDPTFLPAFATGNPHALAALLGRSVLESNAAGFGSLTMQQPDEQHVDGVGRWRDGKWRVVMTRTLETQGEGDVTLHGVLPIAVAVWDGGAGDRNGTKLISGWHWLELEASGGK